MYSFSKFLENIENNSLSQPQHKKGEESLDIKNLLRKRVLEMANELEVKGKATRDEIFKYLIEVINSLFSGDTGSSKEKIEFDPTQTNDPEANQTTSPLDIPSVGPTRSVNAQSQFSN